MRNHPVVMDSNWVNYQLEAFDEEFASSPHRHHPHHHPPLHSSEPLANGPSGHTNTSPPRSTPPYPVWVSTSPEQNRHQHTLRAYAMPQSKGKRKAIDNPGEEPPQKKRRIVSSLSKRKSKQPCMGQRTLPPRECAAGSNMRRTTYRQK